MNEALQQLFDRNSAPRLSEPGPDQAACQNMFRAALRTPDHAWLRPWRFQVVRGSGREQLGQVFLQGLLARDPDADETARNKAQNAPLRAPLVVVVICCYTSHPKVPEQEQLLSAGCAAHAMLLAAQAQGYAGIWRTGSYAEDPVVVSALGLAANERIVGFLYFGSRDGAAKNIPERKVEDYVSDWPA